MKPGMLHLMILSIILSINFSAFAQWEKVGPRYVGSVLSIATRGGDVFAGMGKGVYVSRDTGRTWDQSGLANTAVNVIILTAGRILAGTDSGLFISMDDGATWLDGGLAGKSISALCCHDTFLVAGAYFDGIYISSDSGSSWKKTAFAGVAGHIVSFENGLYVTSPAGDLFMSTDNGKSWTTITSRVSSEGAGPLFTNGSAIYVGTFGGVYKSTDLGTTWSATSNSWTYGYIFALTEFGDNLLAGTNHGVKYSADGGVTWNPTNIRDLGGSLVAVTAFGSYGTSLFAAAGGISRSTDNGITWYITGLSGGITEHCLSYNGYLFRTAGGGVYRSSNDGETWTAVNAGIPCPRVVTIAANDSWLFAGSESDIGGVYRSTDFGDSWTTTQLNGRSINCLAARDSFLLAAGPAGSGYNGGIFVSTDNGKSWRMSLDRGNNGVLSLAVGETNFFAADTDNAGIFVSTDHGQTWSAQEKGTSMAVLGKTIFVGTFYDAYGFVSKDNGETWTRENSPGNIITLTAVNDTIFAGTIYGLFASADSGVTWGELDGPTDDNWVFGIAEHNGYLFASIAEDGSILRRPISQISFVSLVPPLFQGPDHNSTICSSSVELSWSPVHGAHEYRFQLAYDSSFTDLFADKIAGSDTSAAVANLANGATYYWRTMSYDSLLASHWSRPRSFKVDLDTLHNGNMWSLVAGLGSPVKSLAARDSMVFAGTGTNGVFRSKDSGLNWTQVDSGLTCTQVFSLTIDSSLVFAGTASENGGVYKSTNNGDSWTVTPLSGRQIYALAKSGRYLLAGGPAGSDYHGGISLSTDNGTSWNFSLDRGTSGINAVAIVDSTFYATDLNNLGIFVSTDAGRDWTSQYSGSSIASIGRSTFVAASYYSGGYLSRDNGGTWEHVAVDGQLKSVYALASHGPYLFAALPHARVLTSVDTGKTWTEDDSGLVDNIVSFAEAGDYVYAGSSNGHVWRMHLLDTLTDINAGVRPLPLEFALSQNYPNPFNPMTSINYQLPLSGRVTLKVFDVLGREVGTLVDQRQNAGTYKVEFDASRFASGVYFYRMVVAEHTGRTLVSAKKMALVK